MADNAWGFASKYAFSPSLICIGFYFSFFRKFFRLAARFLHFFLQSIEGSLILFIYHRICSEKVSEQMNLNCMLVIIKSKPFLLKYFCIFTKGLLGSVTVTRKLLMSILSESKKKIKMLGKRCKQTKTSQETLLVLPKKQLCGLSSNF